jgi:hypothetical protein
MLTHFGRAVNIRGRLFNVLRDKEVTGDPGGAKALRRLQDLPAESKFPQRRSTGYNPKQQSIRKTAISFYRQNFNTMEKQGNFPCFFLYF